MRIRAIVNTVNHTKDNKSLRATLVNLARSTARAKNTYLSNQDRRLADRRGGNHDAVAVGQNILVDDLPYAEKNVRHIKNLVQIALINVKEIAS